MNLESAIEYYEKVADYDWYSDDQREYAEECRQLAEWFRELKERKEKKE